MSCAPPAPSNDPALDELLITVDEFPAGWEEDDRPNLFESDELRWNSFDTDASVASTTDDGTTNAQCDSGDVDELIGEDVPTAQAAFTNGLPFEQVIQFVAEFDEPDEADSSWTGLPMSGAARRATTGPPR